MNSGLALREVFAGSDGDVRASAVRIGPLIYAPRLLPTVATGASLDRQLESLFERVRSVLGAAGGDTADVARITVFMRDVGDRRVLNEVWARWFPDPAHRPPHKYIPAEVPGGYQVMADALAVVHGQRRVLNVPRLQHRDPMSIGVRIGNFVFSSRLFAAEKSVDGQLVRLLDHARVLMRDGGGDLRDLTQVTVFVRSSPLAASVQRAWAKHWTETDAHPTLHVVVVNLGGSTAPRMEIIGVIGDRS